jgi:hypothetical protein
MAGIWQVYDWYMTAPPQPYVLYCTGFFPKAAFIQTEGFLPGWLLPLSMPYTPRLPMLW